MDGFTGFNTATTEGLPGAVAVMDPFNGVRQAGEANPGTGPLPAPRAAGHLRAPGPRRGPAGLLPASATSPTTSPGHCPRPAASDPNNTLNHEELSKPQS